MFPVSVIIPVFNCEKYLSRSIESLLTQTIVVEIILVDDGSTDNSSSICDEYSKKYSNILLKHVPNGGAAKAREYGIRIASGEYIGFLDSDDWVRPDMYENLYNEAKHLNLDVIQCGFINTEKYENRNSNFDSTKTKIYSFVEALESLYGIKRKNNFNYLLWNKIVKSEVINKIPMPLEQRSQNDVPVIPKVIFNCKRCACNPEPLVYYFHRNDNKGDSITDALWKSKGKAIFSHITAFYNVTSYFKEKDKYCYCLSMIHTAAWCLTALKSHDTTDECKQYALKILKDEPLYSFHFIPWIKRSVIFIVKYTPKNIFNSYKKLFIK